MNNSILPTYNRSKLSFKRGQGSWLETSDGTRYLDFGSGIAVNSLGHCHPKLVKALEKQSKMLWHTSNLHNIEQQEKLADFLVKNSFGEKVFFTNSGAESVECAIKMARKYHYEKGNSKKNKIITFKGSFHGRTLATIAATGDKKLTNGFGPKLQGFVTMSPVDLETIHKMETARFAAVLVEPIQGEGGIRCFHHSFLNELRALCDQYDMLLIFDEVQCGIGRTGALFAYEKYNVIPDIMTVAKGLGGGFPIGACIATKKASSGMDKGSHGSTFGGNPLACSVANAVLTEITKAGFLNSVIQKSIILWQNLARLIDQYPHIYTEIRGDGMMLGVKCAIKNSYIIETAYSERLLLVPAADNVVRILPPLNITMKDVALGIKKLERVAIALEEAKDYHDKAFPRYQRYQHRRT